ncbi:hypothetical protein M6D93_03195 [Jatrophihabitans telluris]|uniref:Fibronectin type-III domain-containing protein n=1 Tax=Jatrophihabitans telluris TaxID=2038343 RepID=A0ABY4QZH0_9ACTN|nr:hypothetical protein [Jatrophihabitans telluris]UQX89013.1 hypothetical protein M6D93_03195 [Jatrophihabitans telluris]
MAVLAVATMALIAETVSASSHAQAAGTPKPSPVAARTAAAVTSAALPTAQLDGVAFAQKIVGNRVFAGGRFSHARPAGAAPGTHQVLRRNLLSYNLTTGVLDSGFAPTVNGTIRVIAVSPDHRRLYIGGDFTSVNGVKRSRIAALDVRTGALIRTFAPKLSARVAAIIATPTVVYTGGSFRLANGVPRKRLAAFTARTGTLTKWAPAADQSVTSMLLSRSGRHLNVILGGHFTKMNGKVHWGLAAVDSGAGKSVAGWRGGAPVKVGGLHSAVTSLSTDGHLVFATTYMYLSGANLEGAFAVDPATGKLRWVESCRGDVYGSFPQWGQLFLVGHPHDCSAVNGYPQSTPVHYQRAVAFTLQATGVIGPDTATGTAPWVRKWVGTPSPSLVNWFPDISIGHATGLNQGAWSVTGNSGYLVLGGEFLTVNGVGQQGLVRFGVPRVNGALAGDGPMVSGAKLTPTVTGGSAGTPITLTWTANWDQDDKTLTYRLVRVGSTQTGPVTVTCAAETADSEFWHRPVMSCTDSASTASGTYSYRLYVFDRDGHTVVSADTVPKTIA